MGAIKRCVGLLGAFLAVGMVMTSGAKADPVQKADPAQTYEQLRIFGEAFGHVFRDDIHPTNSDAAIEGAINGLLRAIDPTASYITPKALSDMKSQGRGDLAAVGVELTKRPDGKTKIVSALDDYPRLRRICCRTT